MSYFKQSSQTLVATGLLLLLAAAGTTLIGVRYLLTGRLTHLYLVWNLFLAWIPLGAALGLDAIWRAAGRGAGLRWILTGGLGFVWLIFYPNAPYMITDFIHLNRGQGLVVWYDFIIFALMVTTALIAGFLALFLVHRLVSEGFQKPLHGWAFVFAINFLSGFGIYLGRVVRSNSWDLVFNPIILINRVLDSLHFAPLVFSLLFGTFLCLTYAAMYSLTRLQSR